MICPEEYELRGLGNIVLSWKISSNMLRNFKAEENQKSGDLSN
jgi:hypothetical protein